MNWKKRIYKEDKCPINKYFARPISYFLFNYIKDLPISANQVSILGLFYALLCSVFISVMDYPLVIIPCVFLQFTSIFDMLDGMYARYGNYESTFSGSFHERFPHYLIPSILFISLATNSSKYFGGISLSCGMAVIFIIYYIRGFRAIKDSLIISKNIHVDYKPRLVDNKGKLKYIILFNQIAFIYLTILIFSIFNILHYLIFVYVIYYFLIAMGKSYMEFSKGIKP